MASTPRVSVIIAASDAQTTLGAAISSALTQTYQPVEIIVCDAGSSDATGAIAASYGDSVRLINGSGTGLASARGTAVEAASGELCALLDADSLWLSAYLSVAVNAWLAAGGGQRIVLTPALRFADDGLGQLPQPTGRWGVRRLIRPTRFSPTGQAPLAERDAFTLFPRALHDDALGSSEAVSSFGEPGYWLHPAYQRWVGQPQPQPLGLRRTIGPTQDVAPDAPRSA